MTDERPDRDEDVPELLRLSEVKNRCGVPVDTLRRLIEDDALPGAERANNGHVYLRAAAVPSHGTCVRLVEDRLRAALNDAMVQMRLIEVELEAVRNDLELAIENPRAPLGHDLLTLKTRSLHQDPRASRLAQAMSELETSSWTVRAWHQDLDTALQIRADQVD